MIHSKRGGQTAFTMLAWDVVIHAYVFTNRASNTRVFRRKKKGAMKNDLRPSQPTRRLIPLHFRQVRMEHRLHRSPSLYEML